jgi:hypothetical protein
VVNVEAMASRLEATFNVDIDVLGVVKTPRPSGGAVEGFGDPDFTLRGRIRPLSPTRDQATVAGKPVSGTAWVVRTVRFSQIAVGRRLVVRGVTAGVPWAKTLTVSEVRGPKSAYVSDVFLCTEVNA